MAPRNGGNTFLLNGYDPMNIIMEIGIDAKNHSIHGQLKRKPAIFSCESTIKYVHQFKSTSFNTYMYKLSHERYSLTSILTSAF